MLGAYPYSSTRVEVLLARPPRPPCLPGSAAQLQPTMSCVREANPCRPSSKEQGRRDPGAPGWCFSEIWLFYPSVGADQRQDRMQQSRLTSYPALHFGILFPCRCGICIFFLDSLLHTLFLFPRKHPAAIDGSAGQAERACFKLCASGTTRRR